MDDQNYIIDEFLGIHVDDIMTCNKGIYGFQNTKEPQGDRPSCFAERLHVLLYSRRFATATARTASLGSQHRAKSNMISLRCHENEYD